MNADQKRKYICLSDLRSSACICGEYAFSKESIMSRAYRIRVSESLSRTLRAEDSVSTQLELLEVLPPEQMAQLLRDELKGRGFEECDGQLVRDDGDLTTTVDPASGTVTVESKSVEDVELEGQRE